LQDGRLSGCEMLHFVLIGTERCLSAQCLAPVILLNLIGPKYTLLSNHLLLLLLTAPVLKIRGIPLTGVDTIYSGWDLVSLRGPEGGNGVAILHSRTFHPQPILVGFGEASLIRPGTCPPFEVGSRPLSGSTNENRVTLLCPHM